MSPTPDTVFYVLSRKDSYHKEWYGFYHKKDNIVLIHDFDNISMRKMVKIHLSIEEIPSYITM